MTVEDKIVYTGKLTLLELIEDLDMIADKHGVNMEEIHEAVAMLTWRPKPPSVNCTKGEVKHEG